MTGDILPVFGRVEADAAQVLSEPFARHDNFSARTRDPNFALVPAALIGMGTIRLSEDDSGLPIDFVLCLNPNATLSDEEAADIFMADYADHIGGLQGVTNMLRGNESQRVAVMESFALEAIRIARSGGFRNIASVIVMGTPEGHTSGFMLPTKVVDEIPFGLRDELIEATRNGEADGPLPEDVSEAEHEENKRNIMTQHPNMRNLGMVTAATLLPTVDSLRKLIDEDFGSDARSSG